MKKNNIFVKFYHNTHLWIVLTAIGVWVLVFQHFGSQNVYAVGGELDAKVSGNVNVSNMVDVNLQGINGYKNCFYNNYTTHPDQYYRIPITNQ